MKNKFIIAVFIIVYCLVLFSAFNLNISYVEKNGFSKNSKYIWIDEEDSSNSWCCFRKKFEIKEKNLDSYIARIAVDSKYWLYINGNIIIREGGLKRSNKNSIYYDEIELKDFLEEGENTIGILVWHFGKNSFSHIDSSVAGLLFYMNTGNEEIVSNSSWKCIKNTAYLKDEKDPPARLSESNIYYDANLEIENWYAKEFDDSNWENGKILGSPNEKPWGRLIKRNIPMFNWDNEIEEYQNFNEYKNKILDKSEMIELKLPKNFQYTPYLKIESKKGKEIKISNNNKDVENAHETIYITKNGLQEFESLAWINGDKIYYYIPEGVKIISLGYRKTEYPSKVTGSFKCDDDFLNSLYEMCVDTLKVNMRDSYMDCPDRERTMWIADTSIAMEQAIYSLDENASSLYKKGMKDFFSWKYKKALMSVIPSYIANLQLPIQNLIGIEGTYNYYMYVGDKEFLENAYPYYKEYLKLWKINEDGLVEVRGDYYKNLWQWYDTTGNTDNTLIENAWYYYANKEMYNMAVALDKKADANNYINNLEKLKQGIQNNFYVEGKGYKSEEFEGFDGRANAILVLAEIADSSKYEEVSEILINEDRNTPFWEKYILEALCKMNKIDDAQERIKTKYGEMVLQKNDYSTTLWEYFEKDKGSKNHTWSGAPMIIMQKYIAGIEPIEAGYEKISIKPKLENFNKLNSKVETAKGNVEFEINKNNNILNMKLVVPSKTLISIPKLSNNYNIIINNIKVTEDGKNVENSIAKFINEEEKYVNYWIEEGEYKIIIK